MSRFDYVKYDAGATQLQADIKGVFVDLSAALELQLQSPRAKALVFTKLEEAYMWVGKAIRDDQISRNGSAELQEGRNNE